MAQIIIDDIDNYNRDHEKNKDNHYVIKKFCQITTNSKIYEENVKNHWEQIDLMSLLKNKNTREFGFVDGPPFVSGNLHYGHIAVGGYKSTVCNAMSMIGYDATYTLGFDTHGLPIEELVRKTHNLTNADVANIGIRKFNNLCDTMITEVANSWTPLFKKMGRFADFNNVYMTRDLNFMETTIWIFNEMYKKGLVYSGNKVTAYSPPLETPLSNFEAGQNYRDIITKSIFVRFEMSPEPNAFIVNPSENHKTFFVAWTTTPWTLPANLSLCVGPDIDYVLIEDLVDPMTRYIISKKSIQNLYGKKKSSQVKIISEFKGKQLENIHYVPVFPFMTELNYNLGRDNNDFFRILSDSYVKDEGIGTSIVHQAPAFGDDDFRVCEKYGIVNSVNISHYCPINAKCQYTNIIRNYEGKFVLDIDVDNDIRYDIKYNIIKTQEYIHSYPHCCRTDQPLIYRTVKSFFIKVESLKDRMIELNKTVSWYPEEVGLNRFGRWLENAKDWAVSRFRHFGTPIPIWVNENNPDDMFCVGSIDELARLANIDRNTITNLHPEYINDIVIYKNDNRYVRVPDIFDCWFESGSVPFAKIHYPFDEEKSKELESKEFLSDFICEGLDQTRGWFYTLLVISTAILNKAPCKNIVCTGIVLDEHGNKLSKRLKNFEDPNILIEEFGADIIRIYFVRSPLMRAEPLLFSRKSISQLKNRFVPYINSFKFMIEHILNFINLKNTQKSNFSVHDDVMWGSAFTMLSNNLIENIMDKWILYKTIDIARKVHAFIREFKMGHAIDVLVESIDDLANWYLKLNRERLKGNIDHQEQSVCLNVLYTVLMTYVQMWAPFMPFLSEYLFLQISAIHHSTIIKDAPSVFMTNLPTFSNFRDNLRNNIHNIDNVDDIVPEIDHEAMSIVWDLQKICQNIRTIRDESVNHKSRLVPFVRCTLAHGNQDYLNKLKENMYSIQDEINVMNFSFERLDGNVTVIKKFNEKELGRKFLKNTKRMKEAIDKIDEKTLYDLFTGNINHVLCNIDRFNDSQKTIEQIKLEYPSEYFTLNLIPIINLNDPKQDNTIVDNGLMIKLDMTYNETVNFKYNIQFLHSSIQKVRKIMELRPWNCVTVAIDNNLHDHVRLSYLNLDQHVNNSIDQNLKQTLPIDTTNIIILDFTDIANPENIGIIKNLDDNMTYIDVFEWKNHDGTSFKGFFSVTKK